MKLKDSFKEAAYNTAFQSRIQEWAVDKLMKMAAAQGNEINPNTAGIASMFGPMIGGGYAGIRHGDIGSGLRVGGRALLEGMGGGTAGLLGGAGVTGGILTALKHVKKPGVGSALASMLALLAPSVGAIGGGLAGEYHGGSSSARNINAESLLKKSSVRLEMAKYAMMEGAARLGESALGTGRGLVGELGNVSRSFGRGFRGGVAAGPSPSFLESFKNMSRGVRQNFRGVEGLEGEGPNPTFMDNLTGAAGHVGHHIGQYPGRYAAGAIGGAGLGGMALQGHNDANTYNDRIGQMQGMIGNMGFGDRLGMAYRLMTNPESVARGLGGVAHHDFNHGGYFHGLNNRVKGFQSRINNAMMDPLHHPLDAMGFGFMGG